MTEKLWPVQGCGAYWLPERRWSKEVRRPSLCSDADARRAYTGYHRLYTRQTFECLMKRGGFGPGEMDMYAPGWVAIPRESNE